MDFRNQTIHKIYEPFSFSTGKLQSHSKMLSACVATFFWCSCSAGSPIAPLAIARLSRFLNCCLLFLAWFSVFKLMHRQYLGLTPGCFPNKVIFHSSSSPVLVLATNTATLTTQRAVVPQLRVLFHGVMKNGNEYSFWMQPGDNLKVCIALESAASPLLQEISFFLALVFLCQHVGSGSH